MKLRVPVWFALAMCMSVLAVASYTVLADEGPKGKFDAVAEVKSSQGTRTILVTIEVVRPMSREDAMPLRKVLESGGQHALVNAIRGTGRGRLLLGTVPFPLDIVVAEKSEDGWTYVVVTSRNLKWNEVTLEEPSVDYPFAVAVFDVPEFGRGSGTLTPRAALSIGEDGRVSVAEYEGESGRLKDVRRR